jgi:hypothetical protein
MKTSQRLLWTLILTQLLAFAVNAEIVTLTASGTDLGNGNFSPNTNQFSIGPYEVAELLSFPSAATGIGSPVWLDIVKAGKTLSLLNVPTTEVQAPRPPIVVAGPATFVLRASNADGNFCTFRVTPEAFPPDRTLILPPGTNQTQVTLECSTNLVNWSSATNGVYGPSQEAKFFRIKMETAR